MIFLFCRFIIYYGGKNMNYLNVIEILNKMDKKIVYAKLVTYTKNSTKKEL